MSYAPFLFIYFLIKKLFHGLNCKFGALFGLGKCNAKRQEGNFFLDSCGAKKIRL